MILPILPENELERIKNLKSYNILDTLPEKEYDEITYLASQICGTPISLISLLDEKRQWFKSHHGLQATETPREYAFCGHAINNGNNMMIVPDSRLDERFKDNPFVTKDPNVIFYAGIPLITPQGFPLGTLCVIDNEPRNLDDSQKKALRALSNQLMTSLELRLSLMSLSKSEEELKNLNSTKDRLFSIIGHDLRGPLGNINALLDFLINNYETTKPQATLETLKMIQNSAGSTFELLESLLLWAKSNKFKFTFKEETIDLNDIAYMTMELLTDLYKVKNITIINNIPKDIKVRGDNNMVMTILRNLISNAIKFTPNGKKILLSASQSESETIIKIKDEGVGISQKYISRLFNSAHHFSNRGTNGENGSGLGLLLCKEFIEIHNGKIWVKSELGIGSSFNFSIPINLHP